MLAQALIHTLTKLPGVGPRAGQRLALFVLKNPELTQELIATLTDATHNTHTCSVCGNLDQKSPCSICSNQKRFHTVVCVVENIEDIWAIERTQEFMGTYHVLHGNLSARSAAQTMEHIDSLIERVKTNKVQEIILALSSTFDGQTTSHVILKKLEEHTLQISQLAHGVPLGTELEYMDKDTLTMALKGRRHFR